MVKVESGSLGHLERIARQAGDAILTHYESDPQTRSKSDGSPLTLADEAANQVILDELRSWDPSIPVISEESASAPYDERKSWSKFWLVDPLDGTKEFISRNGEFTVNIALIDSGQPVLGVVYAPALDLMYSAGSGLGAWRTRHDGKRERIHCRPAELDAPLTIVESRSHPSKELEDFLSDVNVGDRVAMGSSLKFCVVAEGRADIYPRLGPTMEWDVAAGDCVFRDATRVGRNSSPLTYNKPDLRNTSFVIRVPDAV